MGEVMGVILGFIVFMAIVAGIGTVITLCKNKVVKKLTPAEESQFEIETLVPGKGWVRQ